MKYLKTPILEEEIMKLKIGDIVCIDGIVYTGRDTVLPKIIDLGEKDKLGENDILIDGSIIFHTAVSGSGVGPTSSNKVEIECSMVPLAKMGVRLFLGKGTIGKQTIEGLKENKSAYAVIPPVSALLGNNILKSEIIAYPEEGIEAFHRLKVVNLKAIVAVANGESIY